MAKEKGHSDPQSVLTSANFTALASNVHREGVWGAIERGTGHPSAFHSTTLREEGQGKASQKCPLKVPCEKAHSSSQKPHRENSSTVRNSQSTPGPQIKYLLQPE